MCFSPQADVVVGGIVAVIGVDALRHVESPLEAPVAALPLLFGLHQITEAFVWWGLQGHVSEQVERFAMWVYLLYALAVLPFLVPVAVGFVERSAARQRVIAVFAVLGLVVGGVLALAMLHGPIHAAIEGRHIEYSLDGLHNGGGWTALYVVATCGAMLVSSRRDIATLGLFNLVAIPVLMWLTLSAFISLWCFWAAIVSIVIARYLRKRSAAPASPATPPSVLTLRRR